MVKAATITGFKLSVTSGASRLSDSLKFTNWKMASKMASERWIQVRRKVGALFASKSKQDVMVLETTSGRRLSAISFARQQNGACLNLADFANDTKGYTGFYCCAVGPEALLIQRYFRTTGKPRYAAAFKGLCDALVEACSEITFEALRREVWGFAGSGAAGAEGTRSGVRPAPRCLMWPDLSARFEVCKLLAVERSMGLIVNSELALVPQPSLIAAVVDEVRPVFFGTESLKADQVEGHASADSLSRKLTKSLFSAVISYVPAPLTE
ncbi:MAG: vitamin B12 dependent-methionine synthase activation domain-containing protein [Candidatus Hodgkinia cicadicola]